MPAGGAAAGRRRLGHEIKLDGYRVQLRIAGGAVTVKTRKGLDWSARFAAIAREARALPDAIVDGEIVALDKNGAPDFAALQAALSEEKTGDLIFYAFDLLFDGTADLRQQPLTARKARLRDLLEGRGGSRLRYVDHFETGGDAILKSACRLSLEGIISKRLEGPYRSGRSESWVKSKCRAGHEVVIGGWTTTNGRFRSLLAGVHRGEHFVYVGRVGTGYSEKTVERLLPKLQAVKAATTPFTGLGAPKPERSITWARPELVAEIEFAGWTGAGNVRQAAFKGLREDKPAAEVEAEAPVPPAQAGLPEADSRVGEKPAKTARAPAKATVKAAVKAAAKPPAHAKPAPPARGEDGAVMGVLLSNPDKALWPEADDGVPVTKRDLARYFEAVGAWLLPHIKGRPCSIIRAPGGIGGRDLLPAPRHARHLQPVRAGHRVRRPQTLSADRPRRGPGRGGAGGGGGTAPVELPARPAGTCPAGWSSTSTRART